MGGTPAGGGRAGRRAPSVSFGLLLAAMLPGCAPPADFGRAGPSVINDAALPWVGDHAARYRVEPVSSYPLTDAEREMRQTGYALLMPGHPLDRWNWFWAELRRTRIGTSPAYAPDPQGYCNTLYHEAYRSSASRFHRIAHDIRADRQRIPPFFAYARRVAEADRVRMGAAGGLPNLTEIQIRNARDRVAENEMIVRWVREGLVSRVQSYRCALHKLVVATPDTEAVLAERELALLEQDIAGLGSVREAGPPARDTHVRPYFPVNRRIEVEPMGGADEPPPIK